MTLTEDAYFYTPPGACGPGLCSADVQATFFADGRIEVRYLRLPYLNYWFLLAMGRHRPCAAAGCGHVTGPLPAVP